MIRPTLSFVAFVLGALLVVGPAFAGIVVNDDCEQAFSVGWLVRDGIPVGVAATPLIAVRTGTDMRPGSAGVSCFQISGRDHVQDGPRQSITSALAANGNGRTYTTRLWFKLAPGGADASVRCLLRWVDGGAQQVPLILAEAVVTQSGIWIEATGTARLQWNTSLTSATLEFEVEQLHKGNPTPFAPTWFPTYLLDDLTLAIDTDGDGLWDSEESADHGQTSVSFLDNADSDGDRMTDDWEAAHLMDARNANDALTDLDADGFNNAQEYFAATNPRAADSYPGKPSDAQASAQTLGLLRYLALCPYEEQSLVGQMVSDNATEYDNGVAALAAQPGGKWVAMLGVAVEKQYGPLDIHASIDHAIAYANAGGIAQLKWAMWNPWRAHLFTPPPPWNVQFIGVPGDLNMIDIPGLLDPAGTPTIASNTAADNLEARAEMDGWIDSVAVEIQRFNAATGGKPLLFRPISEMNGGWFWWGHRTRSEYLGLWNHIRDRLITVHGLHNLIWVYESASSEHVAPSPNGQAAASDYYYPGDDAVDVFGHNLYDGDWVLPFDANKVYARHPKIYGVPQAGPDKKWPHRAGQFDNLTYSSQITARYPRNSFFIVWNSIPAHLDDDNDPNTPASNDDPDPSTTDDPLQHLAIIDNLNAAALLADPRMVTRDELPASFVPVGVESGPGRRENLASLAPPAPNPARASFVVAFTLARAEAVRLRAYDVIGREVLDVPYGLIEAGSHRFALDAARLPAGVYLFRLETPSVLLSRKLHVVR